MGFVRGPIRVQGFRVFQFMVVLEGSCVPQCKEEPLINTGAD